MKKYETEFGLLPYQKVRALLDAGIAKCALVNETEENPLGGAGDRRLSMNEDEELPDVNADTILNILPWAAFVDGDECSLAITTDIVDDRAVYVVGYDRTSDGWTCATETGRTLVEAAAALLLRGTKAGWFDLDAE